MKKSQKIVFTLLAVGIFAVIHWATSPQPDMRPLNVAVTLTPQHVVIQNQDTIDIRGAMFGITTTSEEYYSIIAYSLPQGDTDSITLSQFVDLDKKPFSEDLQPHILHLEFRTEDEVFYTFSQTFD